MAEFAPAYKAMRRLEGRLAEVLPCLAPSDIGNGGRTDAEHGRQSFEVKVGSANRPDTLLAQSCAPVSRSDAASDVSPPLRDHVCDVIGIASKKKVRNIHARRVIAAVQYSKSRRNGTFGKHPRYAMGVFFSSRSVGTAADSECSVASGQSKPSPHMARACAARSVDLLLESYPHVQGFRAFAHVGTIHHCGGGDNG